MRIVEPVPEGADVTEPIRAELVGAHMARACGFTITANAPMPALCQVLVENGYPSATPLEAYRDETLCLRVRSIGEGAGLTVTTSKSGAPIFAKTASQGAVAAPSVRSVQSRVLAPLDEAGNALVPANSKSQTTIGQAAQHKS